MILAKDKNRKLERVEKSELKDNSQPLTVNLLEMLLQVENPYLIDLSNLMVCWSIC